MEAARTGRNRLRIVQSCDPGALLAAAADGFLSPVRGPEPFPSPDYLLVLRQGGLRDDLMALAARRGVRGWFDPPLCLFQQIGEWLGSTGRAPLGDYERVVLLSRLLREQAPAVFGAMARPDGFVDAVDRTFGELTAEGVSPDAFEAALDANADRDPFEVDRDADLARCYRAWAAELDAAGRRDGRDMLADAARALSADPDGLAARLGGRRQIRIVGLQDLRGGWSVLLSALRSSPAIDEIAIYSATAIEGVAALDPDPVEWLGERDGFAARLFTGTDAISPAGVPVALVSAPDTGRETEEVARRVRALIEDGVAPADIAVVSRSARPYVDRMLDAFAVYGVPATARRRHAFDGIPVVRAVLALFAVAAEGWTRHGLAELAEQPYFGRMTAEDTSLRRLDPVIINHIGYRRRVRGLDSWIDAHRQLHDAAKEREHRIETGGEEPGRGRDAPPPAYRCENALASFTSFARLAADLDSPRPLREWVDWLRRFLENDPWRIESRLYRVPGARYDVVRIDDAGLRGMRGIVSQWNAALSAWSDGDEVMSVVAFESVLREMLSGDAALWTPVRRGVQVLEGLAAAQRSFDHVFVVGLSGDTFPLRAPRSPIFDEHDRQHLVGHGIAVETRGEWESRERALFTVLVMAARRSLTLCWPRSDEEGRERPPSSFVEEVVIAAGGAVAWPTAGSGLIHTSEVAAPSLPLIASGEQREQAAHGSMIERIRATGSPSAWNGLIEDGELLEWLSGDRLGESCVWSATQLESYAKCPWAWYSQRLLRLDDLDDPDIDMDPLVRGAVLHEALRHFYDAARSRLGGPVFLRETDADWVGDAARSALDRAMTAAGGTSWLGAPALRETKKNELQRLLAAYIEWEIEYNEKHYNSRSPRKKTLRTGVEQHELAFGTMYGGASGEDRVLELAGVRFLMRGSIDRVEVGVDDRLGDDSPEYLAAVDYKSGKYSTPGAGKKEAWTDGVVLQVPLYAHVLERMRPGSRVARVEYRAIRQRETVHSMELVQVTKAGLEEQKEHVERMDRALDAAGEHVRAARAGEYPADPAPSCRCPPFCHAWDICRVRGGPKTPW